MRLCLEHWVCRPHWRRYKATDTQNLGSPKSTKLSWTNPVPMLIQFCYRNCHFWAGMPPSSGRAPKLEKMAWTTSASLLIQFGYRKCHFGVGMPPSQNGHPNSKLSQQRTLTEGGLEFKVAQQSNQCIDFLNKFRKSPDVYSV